MILPAPFFLRIVLAIRGLLCLRTNCEMFCSSSVKNAISILIGVALYLQVALGSMVILTILTLPIQEHGISFHLFVSSSIYINVLESLVYMSLTSQVKFIPTYFILFCAVAKGIVFLISLSGNFFISVQKCNSFFILNFYSANLLNLLISSNRFFFCFCFLSFFFQISSQ